ncbi:MAG: tyrosine-type recombinase/integrase [Nitrospirae bacterium]|nr:tyrosine-type recombinase/integrase [Nitrospirota bacterium]
MGLTKRKDGYYVEFPVLDDGKVLTLARGTPRAKVKRWKTGTLNKTMAKQQEAMIKTDLMKGMIVSARVKGPVTFKALGEGYLAFPDVKRQSSFSTKQTTIDKRFIPYFGDVVLSAITPSMIEQYREQRRQEKRENRGPLKVATLNRDLALLKHMFSYAVREEWVLKNPVSQVKLWKENNVRDRVLDTEEFERLQAHSAPHLQAINQMAYQTGMRSGEILDLTWDRVDFKAGMIRLRPEDTKTEEARLIPLTPELTHLLRDLYKLRYLHEDHVFLVKGQSVNSVKTAFKSACRRAKIEGFKFHDFRHTAVTNMRRAGIDHLTIMRITGHKTLEVFKRYNSFLEGDLKDAASRFNTYLTLAHSSQKNDSPKLLINH